MKLLFWKVPNPSFKNVVPCGAGYYRFSKGKWHKVEDAYRNDKDVKYLSEDKLWQFALDAVIELRK
jgi:hypothetical protein